MPKTDLTPAGVSFNRLIKDIQSNGHITQHFTDCYARITNEYMHMEDYVNQAEQFTEDREQAHEMVAEMFARAFEEADLLLPDIKINDWLGCYMNDIITERQNGIASNTEESINDIDPTDLFQKLTTGETEHVKALQKEIARTMMDLNNDGRRALLEHLSDPSTDLPQDVKDALMANQRLKILYLGNNKPPENDIDASPNL